VNTLSEKEYADIPWAKCTEKTFAKPAYEQLPVLKKTAIGDRSPLFTEFYELQTYLNLMKDVSPSSILDIGCGSGSLSYLFSAHGWEVTSCDRDAEGFEFKKEKFIKCDLNEAIPASSGTFAAVVCKQVVEHLRDPRGIMGEFYRVLKPGGVLIFSIPNITSLLSRFYFLRSGRLRFYEEYWQDHCTLLHYEQIMFFLKACGFKDIGCYTELYEMFNLNPAVNGKRMRFIVPILKWLSDKSLPEVVRYGKSLIFKAGRPA